MAVHSTADAVTGHLLDVFGQRQGEPAGAGRPYDRGGEDVRGDLVEAGGVAQDVVGGHVGRREDVGDARVAGGDRAGLVEQQDLAARELFQRGAALHDDAAASRP